VRGVRGVGGAVIESRGFFRCWVVTCRSLKIACLVALLPVSLGAQPELCFPDREGKLIRAASGFRHVPVRGRIISTPSHRDEIHLKKAWFAKASTACPNLNRESLRVDSRGNFTGRITLTADFHWYCHDGEVVEETWTESPKLVFVVPGCQAVRIRFDPEADSFIEIPCKPADGAPLPSHLQVRPQRSGATVEIKGSTLYVDGRPMTLPLSVQALTDRLGSPGVRALAGDHEGSNDVYEWESLGVFAYSRKSEAVVHALGFVLSEEHNSRRWCHPGVIDLVVNDVHLDRKSRRLALHRAGFKERSLGWELPSKGMSYSLSQLGDPPTLVELEIGISDH